MNNREQIYYKSGSVVPFFGDAELILRVRRNFYIKGTTIEVKQSGERQYLIIETDNDSQRFIHYSVVCYFEKCAKGLFDVYLSRLAERMEISYEEIEVMMHGQKLESETLADFTVQNSRLRRGETVWSMIDFEQKILKFDWKIAMLPIEIIEFLFAYELAHLIYEKDSKQFWQAIEKAMPDYMMCREWLENHKNEYENY